MEYSTIRWGIMAPGKIARKFADDLNLVPGAEIYAVASSSGERARAFAADYQVPYAFDNYDDIARCGDLNIIYIASPHSFHVEQAILCLENGRAVLCEKPIALNGRDARRMVDAARQNGVFLMEALWTRFIPATVHAMELVQSGTIGEVHTQTADFGFKAPYDPASRLFNLALGGGALLDIGIYPALLSMIFFGKPDPSGIQAAAAFAPTGADISIFFIFDYGGGRITTGQATFAAHTPLEATLYGETASLRFHHPFHNTRKLTLTTYADRQEQIFEFPFPGWGYQFEAIHVQDCLKNGLQESPILPLQFSLDLIDTLDAIRSGV